MKKNRLFMVLLLAVFFEGCYMPPPVRPAISQTVVTVQRYSSQYNAKSPMEIYIDDVKSSFSVENGNSVSIPVNDGVHYIFVKVEKNQSEILNFTAAQRTVSFIASVEGGFLKKNKVVLSRSKVIDDTGEMTNKSIQKQYIPEE